MERPRPPRNFALLSKLQDFGQAKEAIKNTLLSSRRVYPTKTRFYKILMIFSSAVTTAPDAPWSDADAAVFFAEQTADIKPHTEMSGIALISPHKRLHTFSQKFLGESLSVVLHF